MGYNDLYWSIVMFGVSLVLFAIAAIIWYSASGANGMFGPSPAALLIVALLIVASLFNLSGATQAKKYAEYWRIYKDSTNESRGEFWYFLNIILPVLTACLLLAALFIRPR